MFHMLQSTKIIAQFWEDNFRQYLRNAAANAYADNKNAALNSVNINAVIAPTSIAAHAVSADVEATAVYAVATVVYRDQLFVSGVCSCCVSHIPYINSLLCISYISYSS